MKCVSACESRHALYKDYTILYNHRKLAGELEMNLHPSIFFATSRGFLTMLTTFSSANFKTPVCKCSCVHKMKPEALLEPACETLTSISPQIDNYEPTFLPHYLCFLVKTLLCRQQFYFLT
ncbi:hypothetical protein Hanom_Chr06g00520251 [Helianthus anomalus]